MMSPDRINRSLLRLVLYYALLTAGTLLLMRYSSAVREAVSVDAPAANGGHPLSSLAAGAEAGREGGEAARPGAFLRTALAMTGALVLAIPVAWVYMLSKQRQRWDPSVVQTVILLPLVVAGIAALVRNSLALAFSLAGLAAAVRFRNTLKDTKDAVYIFLAIAVGLAAGVQALALAFIVSVMFNGTVIALWALNVGDIYAGEPRPTFTREFAIVDPERPDGFLVVVADGPAQERVEAALHLHVSHWKLVKLSPSESGKTSLTYLVRLKKKAALPALLAGVAATGASVDFQPRAG
jgi:hypothetical protein